MARVDHRAVGQLQAHKPIGQVGDVKDQLFVVRVPLWPPALILEQLQKQAFTQKQSQQVKDKVPLLGD
jgi:hypothetical protein